MTLGSCRDVTEQSAALGPSANPTVPIQGTVTPDTSASPTVTPSIASPTAPAKPSAEAGNRPGSTPTGVPTTASVKTVTIYQADAQCSELIPAQTEVPANQPIKGAIAKVIEQQNSGDFQLTGYQVNVANGIATIDLQIAPGSQRQIESLSTCEQLALFGSLRETLLQNPEWQITEVRFTEQGEEIAL